MEAKWLSVQSFQNNQRLISAINTLCIHWKLQLEGLEEDDNDREIREAKTLIRAFLRDLDRSVLEYEHNRFQALPSITPKPLCSIGFFWLL